MLPLASLSTLALFLASSGFTSAAPIDPAAPSNVTVIIDPTPSNTTVLELEPGIVANWTLPISGPVLTGPAFSDVKPEGAVDTLDARSHERGDGADYTDIRRCPGGAWGGAHFCTFEPIKVWNRHLRQTQMYGAWYNQCGRSIPITTSVSDSVAITNSIESTVGFSLGFMSPTGSTAGMTASLTQGWSRSETVTGTRQITIEANRAGYLGVQKDFVLSEGRIRINFRNRRNGHWVWYSYGHNTAVPIFSRVTTYTGIQQRCPARAPSQRFEHTAADRAWTMAGGHVTHPLRNP